MLTGLDSCSWERVRDRRGAVGNTEGQPAGCEEGVELAGVNG